VTNIDDCVVHVNGGPQMRVEAITAGTALCTWTDDDGNPRTGSFALAELLPCTPKDHSAP
jgi:uncharacterized protein YodC (DUF2158 family)